MIESIFSICVVLLSGEGLDCSYQFYQLDKYALHEAYFIYGGKLSNPDSFILGFMEPKTKFIFINEYASMNTIEHEIKHIKCYLEYQRTGINHEFCIDKSKHFMY